MTKVLYVNDNNLLLQDGNSLQRSQGYAWLKNGAVYFDFEDIDNAVAACRLEPQQINSRYWQQCEQTALPSNDSGMRHAADLIWRHLNELKERCDISELALVVPAHYRPDNLQLLLGIAQSCGIKVSGLVNKAVLAGSLHDPADANLLHVDVQLHQTVCSQILFQEGICKLGSVEVMHEVGLQAMQDALLKAAQERFIQSDRFDPLHYAETEQQLFDQLTSLAASIKADGKANMVVVHAGNQHACSIDARQWQAALQPFMQPLVNARADINPSSRLYDFNGFEAIDLHATGQGLVQQTQTDLAHLNLAGGRDDAGNVIYQAELPRQSSSQKQSVDVDASVPVNKPVAQAAPEPAAQVVTSDQPANGAADHPTHLLIGGIATPIGRAHVSFSGNAFSIAAGGDANLASLLKSDQLFVMGDQGRHEIRINDRLGSNLADGVITVIRVE